MQTKNIEYNDQGVLLEGFLAYSSDKDSKKPTVILCHAWRGRDEFVCVKAQEFAKKGYTAFALDVFGKGVLGKTKEENEALMDPFIQDRRLLRRRLLAGLDTVCKQPQADPNRIAVMGFCFGGLCALDLARSGANIKGAISVHGLLNEPSIEEKPIKAKILALHGYEDPMVPREEVLAFEEEMTRTHVDWQLYVYGKTMHAFTNPLANDPAFGTVYNPTSAKRAWQSIDNFLQECLN